MARFVTGTVAQLADNLTLNNVTLSQPEISVLNDGHVSLDSMRKMADKKEGWNFYFDRNQIPAMKEIVKLMLAP